MIRGEDHRRRRDRAAARAPRRASTRTARAERQNPESAGSRAGTRAPATSRFHAGKSTGSAGGGVAVRRLFDQRSQLPTVARLGERALVDARLKRVLERDHQLDAIERAQPELLERRLRRQRRRGRRTSRPAPRARRRRPATRRRRARRSSPSRGSPRVSACACLRCAAAPVPARRARAGSSDDRRAARSPPRTTASASAPGSSTSTACTRSSDADRHADDRRIAHAGDAG